jgi:ectoine hydroxylase-related dioxygenase (phytanoyl-CoA dioxygenase family)
MIYKINNEPFYNLGNYIDYDSFEQLLPSINYNIALSCDSITPTGTSQSTLYNQDEKDVTNLAQSLRKLTSDLNLSWKQYLYVAMFCKSATTLGSGLYLTQPKDTKDPRVFYHTKHQASSWVRTQAASRFNFLFDWIDAQNCFKEYGRIMFFIVDQYSKGALHRDNYQFKEEPDDFLYIQPSLNKRLTIFDPDTKQVVYNPHNVSLFNTNNWHQAENNSGTIGWSLRIDGVFTEEFKSRALL